MSALNKSNFEERYNNGSTGAFKTGQSRGIASEDLRDLVTYLKDSFVGIVDNLQSLTEATGTNAYAITGGITAYSNTYAAFVKFANASTGASTLNVNSISAKKLYINPTTQAGSGDIPANSISLCVYDSALDAGNGGFLIISNNSIDGGSA
jgi:hypothetical protein